MQTRRMFIVCSLCGHILYGSAYPLLADSGAILLSLSGCRNYAPSGAGGPAPTRDPLGVQDFKELKKAEISRNRRPCHPDSVAGLDWNRRLV